MIDWLLKTKNLRADTKVALLGGGSVFGITGAAGILLEEAPLFWLSVVGTALVGVGGYLWAQVPWEYFEQFRKD